MKKTILIAAALILGFITFKYLIIGEGAEVGKIAPEVEATLLDGSEFKLSDLRGDYVLLDFWGSWCAPCRRENPSLVKLYKRYENKKNSQGNGLSFVNIALEKSEGRAEGAIKRDNLYWRHHIVSISRVVLLSPFAQQYNVSSIPSKFLIDPDGKVISVNPTIHELDKLVTNVMDD